MKNADFELFNNGRNMGIKTWLGVEVKFAASQWKLEVTVPACYKQNTDGLCGSWDGNADNDVVGSVVDYGQSHKIGGASTCTGGAEYAPGGKCDNDDVNTACAKISAANGIFKSCHSAVSPEFVEKDCLFDACRDPGMMCNIYEGYGTSCMAALGKDLNPSDRLCRWMSATQCKNTSCPKKSTFVGCADTCLQAHR